MLPGVTCVRSNIAPTIAHSNRQMVSVTTWGSNSSNRVVTGGLGGLEGSIGPVGMLGTLFVHPVRALTIEARLDACRASQRTGIR